MRLIVVVGGLDELMLSLPSATEGAVLSHGNMVENVAGGTIGTKFYPLDVYISYLPLAHIFERSNQIILAYYGSSSGFYQGDNLKLLDDIAVLRPTLFCSVPRLYNKIYDGTINAVKSTGGLKEKIFNVGYNAKRQALLKGKIASSMWERLVFNKIKDKLGGRVRYLFSGASPLSPDVLDFLRVCFGCYMVEGYGMTETSCAITIIEVDDVLSCHVGVPLPSCEVKLVDIPEMNYTSDDQPYPRGEICVRGQIVFQGYYKDEVQTREVIDKEGWLHFGDIGMWIPEGRLKIIDMKKNIFKLAQGEYIAPEKIKNLYTKCKFVAQCFVYGDSFNSCLVAIVSVDPDVLKAWAAKKRNKGLPNFAVITDEDQFRAEIPKLAASLADPEVEITSAPMTCKDVIRFYEIMDDQSQQQECGSSRVGLVLVYDERMCKHSAPAETEHHENPERIRAIWNKLLSAGIPQRVAKPDDKKNTETTDGKPGYVLVIGATNRPDVVDPTLRRPGRFDLPEKPTEAEQPKRSSKRVATEEADSDGRKSVFGSKKNPSFVAAHSRFEELTSKNNSLTSVNCGTELPVTSMLDSPDLFEARFRSTPRFIEAETEENEDWWRKAWTPEEMEKLSITLSDFEVAAKLVQPSSRREGFSSILNVKWEDVGGLDQLRREFDRYIVRRIKYPDEYTHNHMYMF
ncbi:long chain acyl-CoA synthetase 6, peroxisomal-like protein [Tanacetum coccineum]